MYYFQNVIRPFVTSKWAIELSVPVIYGSPERWKSTSKRWIL
jgi:hypothetical protein